MNKILLAFSGGLDTSYCARYFAVELGMEVHTVIVDTGGFSAQELDTIKQRALACGVASHVALDRTDELYQRVLRHCIAGNVLKNSTYPLSVSAERVIQAIAIAEHARAIGATHLAHGSTGAGNDQIRFDVIFRIMCPEIEVLTPIRDMKLSRDQEIAYLAEHGVEGDWTKASYSINQGIWGTTVGGKETLTSDKPLPEDVWPSAVYPAPTDNAEKTITISFDKGQPVALDGAAMNSVELLRMLNDVGARWHIGRDMHVGDTIIGIKGRVAFEAPCALILIKAHHALEKNTLTKWQLTLKDQLSLWYGQLLHEGQFLEPAMRSIEAFFDDTQQVVTGDVVVNIRRERFSVDGVRSANDLMRSSFATYGEENRAWTGQDAKGFATISAVPTSLWMSVNKGDK
ncbi:MAG: argininosuccinate synthase [Candidatus Kapabacteria bacterium]|nr:argininosuccinate synthase [Candidatus Kapabacteria bacterium]